MNMLSASQTSLRVLIPQQIKLDTLLRGGKVHSLSGACMGTTWAVRYVDHKQGGCLDLESRIVALLEQIENQMSHFRPHSDLCRFAVLAAGETQVLPAEFAKVLRCALEVAHLSRGAFDPTLAPLIDAWGFGAQQRFSDAGFVPPAPAQTAECLAQWKMLEVDAQNCIRQPGGVALNLAAIAKGFAVDAVAGLLTQQGIHNHLVEVGGELRGTGIKPDGQPWWVALELPSANCSLPATRLALHGLAVATSGDYRRSYRVGEHFIQHTMDPHTGAPVAHALSSVTVIHPECMLADAWATAVMVLGMREGLALAEKMQLCVLLQGHDATGRWTEATSTAWANLLQ